MVSLDQVLLLQKRVGTAVERIKALSAEIARLQSDNAALRDRCAELSRELSDKTGLVSSLEADQNKIEESILKALNQLDTVENSILNTTGTIAQSGDGPVEMSSEGESGLAGEEQPMPGSPEILETADAALSEFAEAESDVPAETGTPVQGTGPQHDELFAGEEIFDYPQEAEADSPEPQQEIAVPVPQDAPEPADSLNSQFDIF